MLPHPETAVCPPTSDVACYTVNGQTYCDVDVRPSQLKSLGPGRRLALRPWLVNIRQFAGIPKNLVLFTASVFAVVVFHSQRVHSNSLCGWISKVWQMPCIKVIKTCQTLEIRTAPWLKSIQVNISPIFSCSCVGSRVDDSFDEHIFDSLEMLDWPLIWGC